MKKALGSKTLQAPPQAKKAQSSIQNFLCFALYSTSRKMSQLYQKYLDPLELTYPQLLVLVLLQEQNELTVNELGEALHLDSGTVTPLLKRLEQKSLISRVRSKKDERSVLIALTPQGNKILEKLSDLGVKMLCDLNMTPEDVVVLAQRIGKIRAQIESKLS